MGVISLDSFVVFLLVFARVSMLFVAAPLLSSRNIPVFVKIGISFFLSMVVFFAMFRKININVPMGLMNILMLVGEQVLVGIAVGFVAMLIFNSVSLAASFYGFQMGFGIVNVIDPMSQGRVPVTGQFKTLVVILLFLATDAHYLLIMALVNSFKLVPLTGFGINTSVLDVIMKAFSGMFFTAVQISIPIIAVLLMIDIGLGIIAKTMPQLNVFIFGFPVKIMVGMLTMIVIMPVLVSMMEEMFQMMYNSMIAVIGVMK